MHKEEGKTGSWKSPAQNTIDSPGQRRALNGKQDTEQDDYAALTQSTSNKEMGKEINKYFNKNERFICIIEKNCVTLQKISTRYNNTIFDELLRNKRSNAKTEKQSYHCTGRVDESATARVLRTMLVSHR